MQNHKHKPIKWKRSETIKKYYANKKGQQTSLISRKLIGKHWLQHMSHDLHVARTQQKMLDVMGGITLYVRQTLVIFNYLIYTPYSIIYTFAYTLMNKQINNCQLRF